MGNLAFDVAHLLAGGMLVLSFVLLYQVRITATLNVFALQSIVLSLSVAWQAVIQDAPHLLVTAVIAFALKATLGWRVSEDAEVGGIDLAVHGETAYETIQQGSVIKEVRA